MVNCVKLRHVIRSFLCFLYVIEASHGARRSLQSIGLPPSAISFIRTLHDDNKCNVSYKGNIYEGFGMPCGVRQGCPISPLFFAAAVDILLRRLVDVIPQGTVRAFAGDIGVVVEGVDRDGPVLEVFNEFAKLPQLELNIPKKLESRFSLVEYPK